MRLFSPASIVSGVLAVSSLLLPTFAQGGNDNLPNLSATARAPTRSVDNPTTSRGSGSNTRAAKTETASVSDTDQVTRGGLTTTAVITGGGQANTNTNAIPTITGGDATATGGGGLPKGLPTLSGAFKVVPASVPPTANAPYMQTTSLPEGTVFIAVGAILGFLAMSVLLWRGLVAWSLHRSVKKAAQHQNVTDTKTLFGQPAATLYKYSDRESTISLSGLGGKSGRKSTRPTTAPGAAPVSSLFFSPTAGASMQNPGNRGSNYLPAGYYAAGASAPGNAQSHITVGQGHGPSISLSNLGPQAQGYSRARSMGPSPPGSPSLSGDNGHGMQSSSTLNLSRGYGGNERAPSAYLEDLFDADGISSPAPGSGPHPAHRTTPSGRF